MLRSLGPTWDRFAKAFAKGTSMLCRADPEAFRVMEAATLLGGDAMASRMAMTGALQIIDAHTIYEIASLSKDFGGGAFNPVVVATLIGLPKEVLERLALDTGTAFAELDRETKKNPPSAKELAETFVPHATREDMVDRLIARGVRVGSARTRPY